MGEKTWLYHCIADLPAAFANHSDRRQVKIHRYGTARLLWVVLVTMALCGLVKPEAYAQVETPFGIRFTTHDTGDIVIIGNTLLTCPAGAATCRDAQNGLLAGAAANDNYYDMVYVDRDDNPATFNSSSANLILPSSATVLWAGLYWGGEIDSIEDGIPAPDPSQRYRVRFGTPLTLGYLYMTGSLVGSSTYNGDDYHAFVDVTSMVRAAGNGTYRVADVQAGTGYDCDAGWSLVVAYRDPSQPLRNLTVFDGFATVTTGYPDVVIDVSGFVTPLSGPVYTNVGMVIYEGDVGLVGDQMKLNDVVMRDALNPARNFFNSTISSLGNTVTAKDPHYVNQLGFDIDVLEASGMLSNGATEATIRLTTSSDFYYPGVVTFVTDLYAPEIQVAKSVVDLDGGDAKAGDVLEYTVSVINLEQDAAINTVLVDSLPNHTSYIPGSLEILSGANTGFKSDASGDDQAEYDPAGDRVIFRLGSGAGVTEGGTLQAGESTTLRFQVRIDPAVPDGAVIRNQAYVGYLAATLGVPMNTSSPPADLTAVARSLLSATKSDILAVDDDGNGVPSPGDLLEYIITMTNSGYKDATGVRLDDLPDANTTLVAGSVSTSRGTVTSGNSAGDTAVSIDIGAIPGRGGSVTVRFMVAINDPLPAGVMRVANQGWVSSDGLPPLPTDDPDTLPVGDPTVTPVNTVPLLLASKTDALYLDNNGDGAASPGDVLQYTITIANDGYAAANEMWLDDVPDTNTTLVAGSVTTSQGTVISGNAMVDSVVKVNVGKLPRLGGSVTVRFLVTVNDSLPAGVTQVANQGLLNSRELPTLPTDDPDTPPVGDPTITPVTRLTGIGLTKKLLSENPALEGELVTFTLRIANNSHTTLVSIPMADIYSVVHLNFVRAVPAPDDVHEVMNSEMGWLVWDNLATHFGPLLPGAAIEVQLVMTATKATPETINSAFVEDAVDEYGSYLDAFAIAPVTINPQGTAVELLSFEAESRDGVLLSWETAIEIENYGFELVRNDRPYLGTAARIAFVPGQGTGPGRQYSYLDPDVTSGKRYWYWLVDIDLSGRRTVHTPFEIWFSVQETGPVLFYLPLVLHHTRSGQ